MDIETLDQIFPKSYVASQHEQEIYEKWEASGAFQPSTDKSRPVFSIVMPPPNANGNLHIGHALEHSLIDAITRYHRLKGERTLLLPGSDHAGIETQVVFEKKLEKEGRSRFQLTREEFYKDAYAFTVGNKGTMEAQMRTLGVSCNWEANRFTLDPLIIQRVYKTFRQLYDQGLIYRGERIVNYCVKYQTAYSDLEVVHEERVDPLYYIKYGPITVATVRPETKFGEKVLVVHPKDERYQQYIGQKIVVKTVTGEEVEMEVIADEAINPEFGTGAMTITPAHDPVDFEIAQRHGLPLVSMIGTNGRLLIGPCQGLKVTEARQKMVEMFTEQGLIEKIDPTYQHSVALCYKSRTVIEPLVLPQWYLNVQELKLQAIAAIEKNEVKFQPVGFRKILLDWLAGLRDWNISRQIWWGIPINEAYPEKPEISNDTDTFDTWFSSSQWPFALLEMWNGEEALADFYPTSLMCTGRDLVFRWVTTMLLMGLYTQKQVPFREVYFHGMVNDAEGKKMSKSKGNVVSPLDMVAKYGADAVRFGLVIGSAAGSDIPFPEEKMVGGRNFANKLWNMSRFALLQLDGRQPSQLPIPQAITEADRHMFNQLNEAIKEVRSHMEKMRLAQALQAVHEVAWHQFADIYIEATKPSQPEERMNDQTAANVFQVLQTILILAHPFMPFVTEAIYQRLPEAQGQLIVATWPTPLDMLDLPHA